MKQVDFKILNVNLKMVWNVVSIGLVRIIVIPLLLKLRIFYLESGCMFFAVIQTESIDFHVQIFPLDNMCRHLVFYF